MNSSLVEPFCFQKILFAFLLMVVFIGPANCDDGARAWLVYDKVINQQLAAQYSQALSTVTIDSKRPIMQSIANELKLAKQGLGLDNGTGGGIVVLSAKDAAYSKLPIQRRLEKLAEEGFVIRQFGTRWVVASPSDRGALYGVFRLLFMMRSGQSIENLDLQDEPAIRFRLLNHWYNWDRSVERGYAGQALFDWSELPKTSPRYTDYARMLASVGVNGVVLNNVNADPRFLASDFLKRLPPLAALFRSYGIKLYLSANFASPKLIGNLQTADPLDENVKRWWIAKIDEICRLIPDFGGLLVKANSEGQPGPLDYKRTHAEGANMLARALKPHGGTLFWRAFVYNVKDEDRAKAAYNEFKPLDGRFDQNVVLQIKNGPLDFQVREPVSPLFGKMPKTNLGLELQITQEYTGQNIHLCFLAPMWKEVLDFRPELQRRQTLADLLASQGKGKLSSIAGVSNVGDDANWTGHDLAQSNLYAFGRMAWKQTLEPSQLATEWTTLTFGGDRPTTETITDMLINSWPVYEKYTSPRGLNVISDRNHLGPDPASRRYFHRADQAGVGFDRTVRTGSGYVSQYSYSVARIYENLSTCPENLVLFFHHLSWEHPMQDGRSLLDVLISSYDQGVIGAKTLYGQWKNLRGKIDDKRHQRVLEKLSLQVKEAEKWRDTCQEYFLRVAKSGQ